MMNPTLSSVVNVIPCFQIEHHRLINKKDHNPTKKLEISLLMCFEKLRKLFYGLLVHKSKI